LKTSPNINLNQNIKKNAENQIAGRAINSSHEIPKNSTNVRLFQTQKYRNGSQSENEKSVKSNSN
jgi:hypothetical protein